MGHLRDFIAVALKRAVGVDEVVAVGNTDLRSAPPPNNPLQRSVIDKVLGRGRGRLLLRQVTSARVLERTRSAAERGRYASFERGHH